MWSLHRTLHARPRKNRDANTTNEACRLSRLNAMHRRDAAANKARQRNISRGRTSGHLEQYR
jgi:hypothetical protein